MGDGHRDRRHAAARADAVIMIEHTECR